MIDEKKLIEEIDYYIQEAGWGDEVNKVLEHCKEFIKAQRKIKIGEWIPCSECLPERDILCLVTYKSKNVGKMKYYVTEDIGWNGELADNPVIAWQPLPEPYQPKRGLMERK